MKRKRTHSGIGGVIKQIHVVNFMCHDNFCIQLGPKINFICGMNGSGKSAIQTALVVGLGGRASWTGRGTAQKDLIKNGKNSCTIQITLNNTGFRAFKPELYGSEITVERIITLSGPSFYKFKSETGVVLSKVKDELDSMLLCFNIQINNPIAILHQDLAKRFLNADDPKKKFEFFSRATLHDSIEEHHKQTNCNVNEGLYTVERKEEVLENDFRDIELLRKQVKALQEGEEKVVHRELVRNELSWAKVYEVEALINKCLKQKEKIHENIQKLNTNLERCNVDDNDLLSRKRNLEQEISDIQKEIENTSNKLITVREHYGKKRGRFESANDEIKQLGSKLKVLKTKETTMKEMVHKATHPDPEMENIKKAEQMKLEKFKEEVLDVDSALQTSNIELNQLVETHDKIRADLAKFINELKNIRFEQNKRHMNIKTLKQESNNLSMYSNFMPKLVAAINAEKRFREKPRGPIGAYIKVKEPSWAAAVENFIGKGTLSGFCVSSSEDYELLQRVINGVCSKDGRPTIFKSKFLYKIHDVRETKLHGYSNLLRGLEISDPVVANCLIDSSEIETVLMIPTNEQAFKIMGNIQNVPQYCKRAFTLKCDIFYPAPNYKSYGSKMRTNKAMLLQQDNNNTIRVLQEEERELSRKVNETEQLRRTMDLQNQQLQESILKVTNVIQNYSKQKKQYVTNIRYLEEKIENEMVQPMRPIQMETELQNLQESVKRVEDQIKDLRGSYGNLESEVDNLKEEVSSLEQSVADFNTNKSNKARDIYKIESELRNKNTQQAQYQEKLKQHEDLSLSKDREMETLNNNIDMLKREAVILAPDPVVTNRSIEEITKELSSLDIFLNTLEKESGGDLAQVTTLFQDRVKEYDTHKNNVGMFKGSFTYTGEVIKDRVKLHKKRQKQIAIFVSQTFDTYLSCCDFKGELQFDHKMKELHINVSPKNEIAKDARQTASLSGGEKSYSTAAFVMSLWSHLQLPFYFLDEFDVFMDMVNRDRIMEMLINRAKEQMKQFVFVTPLDISKVEPSDDLQVFRLNPPRD